MARLRNLVARIRRSTSSKQVGANRSEPNKLTHPVNNNNNKNNNNNSKKKNNKTTSGRPESELGKNKDFGSCDNDNSEIKTYKIPRKLH